MIRNEQDTVELEYFVVQEQAAVHSEAGRWPSTTEGEG